MYLVTEGKRKENQLGYAPKTHEYVYLHPMDELVLKALKDKDMTQTRLIDAVKAKIKGVDHD